MHHTFGPHATAKTCLQAKLLIAQPWKWKKGGAIAKLRSALQREYGGEAALFSSGREALLAILQSMKLQTGEEVIIQGFTCAVLPNAIHAAKGVPVYADIDPNSLNLTVETVEKLISPRTRAVICQHTFGIPADVQALQKLCEQHSIALIEDCAHVLPKTIGDLAFFSFGRDKAISGVSGGAVISKNAQLSTKNWEQEVAASSLSMWTIFRLLLYPCLYVVARPIYGIGLGKALLKITQQLHLLLPVVSDEEKKGQMQPLLHALPNACATLALTQFRKHNIINQHRKDLTTFYRYEAEKHDWNFPNQINENISLQKFPIFVEDADARRADLKQKNIHLDDGWTGAVVCPRSTDQQAMNYEKGSCPNAENASLTILSLPTHPGMSLNQAKKLIDATERAIRS